MYTNKKSTILIHSYVGHSIFHRESLKNLRGLVPIKLYACVHLPINDHVRYEGILIVTTVITLTHLQIVAALNSHAAVLTAVKLRMR